MKVALLILLCLFLTLPVFGASSAELQKELDALKQEARTMAEESAALEAELEENRSQVRTTIEAKSDVDRQIHMTEQEIRNINDQIQQYSLLISQKQSELEDAEEAHREMNETYKTRLRAMEESGTISYWSVLFRSKSFADLLDRISMIREIAAADQAMLEKLSASARQLELDRDALRADLEAQEAAKLELTALEAELNDQRMEADSFLLMLAQAEASLSEEYLAVLEEEKLLQQEIIAAQAAYESALSAEQAARLAAANQNNAAGGQAVTSASDSGFISPLPAGAWITSAYGPRKHPLYGYDGFHTGIDLAANRGTAIYAIAAGTVAAATYQKINGNYASLTHGNGYGSLYAHMDSCIVSAGDYVNQGDIIGYVGSTGWSSGPHLHFEIYVNGAAVNPAGYIGF